MKLKLFFAGSGGQGTLAIGQMIAKAAMDEGKEVTWLPSYGPEMRGGTASCGIIVSDGAVGSPIVAKPDILVAMNLPSLDRYEDAVKQGGMIFYDSSLIERPLRRTDVKAYAVPATRLAGENGFPTLGNMILVGKILAALGEYTDEGINAALAKVISAKRADMLEVNRKALELGANY